MPSPIAAVLAAALLASSTPLQATPAAPAFSAARVEATVRFLADDLLEGRDTGSTGHEIAAAYVASRFAELGLTPAGGDGSWFQRVPLLRADHGATPATVTISAAGGQAQSWQHGSDVLVGLSASEPRLDVSAPAVFVGFGIKDRRFALDDYAGLDVRGRIVVTLRGAPNGLPSEEAAHLAATKRQTAQAHGAIGMVTIGTLLSNRTRPWERTVASAGNPRFAWVDTNGKPFDEAPQIRASVTLNEPAALALFEGAPQSLASVRAIADREGGRPRGFALRTRIHIRSDSVTRAISSPNVVAVLPGSDPVLKHEYVILSAHLDHIGISPERPADAPGRDRINNGALDNAAGIATMLEVAGAAAGAAVGPRRSIIFLASTAEEKGLLGTDYFARHPSVPLRSIVGNVGLDMPLLLYPFTDVTAFGADHSTLGPAVAAAVAPMGLKLSPDPMPQEGIFVRSDHYRLVTRGIPAVFLATGFANGGADVWARFLGPSGAYHRPGDDLHQPIDWQQGARFAEANYRIMRAIADSDAVPRWYAGDFFGDTFAPRAAKARRATP